MVGAGTGAGVVGARGEMMETKSERMKAKSVTIIPWLVWVVGRVLGRRVDYHTLVVWIVCGIGHASVGDVLKPCIASP